MTPRDSLDYIDRQASGFLEKVLESRRMFSEEIALQMLSRVSTRSGITVHQLKILLSDQRSSLKIREQVLETVKYLKWLIAMWDYLKELHSNFKSRVINPVNRFTRNGSASSSNASFSSRSSYESQALLSLKQEIRAVHLLLALEEEENGPIEDLFKSREILDYIFAHCESDLSSKPFEGSLITVYCPPESQSSKALLDVFLHVFHELEKEGKAARNIANRLRRRREIDKERDEIMQKAESELNRRLNRAEDAVDRLEGDLEAQTGELQVALKREDRPADLSAQLFATELRLQKLRQKLDASRADRLLLQEARKNGPGQRNHRSVRHKTRLEREISDMRRELETTHYHRDILTGDLMIENTAKPEIVRLTNDLEEQCEQLETVLDDIKSERERLRTALGPIQSELHSGEDSQVSSSSAGSTRTLPDNDVTPTGSPEPKRMPSRLVRRTSSRLSRARQDTTKRVTFSDSPTLRTSFRRVSSSKPGPRGGSFRGSHGNLGDIRRDSTSSQSSTDGREY